MANTSYLLGVDAPQPASPTPDNILLEAPYHLPLLWVACLAREQLFEQERVAADAEPYLGCGAVLARSAAMEQLRRRTDALANAFASRGDLRYHIALFLGWLDTLACEYLCLDWSEYNFLNGDEHERVKRAIAELDALPVSDCPTLLDVSTVIEGARFVTLEQAQAGDYSDDEMASFFRLLGDSYTVPVPWR